MGRCGPRRGGAEGRQAGRAPGKARGSPPARAVIAGCAARDTPFVSPPRPDAVPSPGPTGWLLSCLPRLPLYSSSAPASSSAPHPLAPLLRLAAFGGRHPCLRQVAAAPRRAVLVDTSLCRETVLGLLGACSAASPSFFSLPALSCVFQNGFQS